jgi:hypothetical protein
MSTTEESNLFIGDKSNKLHFNYSIERGNSINQFVYITNNDKIGVDDAYYNYKTKTVQHRTLGTDNNSYLDCSKVILTNNPNLKNVQQLTEEELQLLVDNFSDSVEVDSVYKQQLNCCKEVCEFKQCHSFFECKYVDEDDLSKIYSLVFSPKKK